MFSLIIAVCCGAMTGLALYFTDTFGYGWSCFFGVLGFGAVQMGIGFFLQWLIYNFISDRIMNSRAGNLFHVLPFAAIMTPLLAVYLAVGVLVGAFGGGMAIRNYLKV